MQNVYAEAASETSLVSTQDRGLLYGDGVWETLPVRAGKPQLLDAHLPRLQRGLTALNIQDAPLAQLQEAVHDYVRNLDKAVLKIIVPRGDGVRGYNPQAVKEPRLILQSSKLPDYPPAYAEQGVTMGVCQTRLAYQPLLAGFKHLNRLEQVLARAEFADDWQEALVSDYHGQVIEGTMSNLFVITQNDQVLTPDLSGCGIAGIMRDFIITQLQQIGLTVQQCPLCLEADILTAKALFLSNSLIGVWPVQRLQVATQTYSYNIPSLVRQLQHLTQSVT